MSSATAVVPEGGVVKSVYAHLDSLLEGIEALK